MEGKEIGIGDVLAVVAARHCVQDRQGASGVGVKWCPESPTGPEQGSARLVRQAKLVGGFLWWVAVAAVNANEHLHAVLRANVPPKGHQPVRKCLARWWA